MVLNPTIGTIHGSDLDFEFSGPCTDPLLIPPNWILKDPLLILIHHQVQYLSLGTCLTKCHTWALVVRTPQSHPIDPIQTNTPSLQPRPKHRRRSGVRPPPRPCPPGSLQARRVLLKGTSNSYSSVFPRIHNSHLLVQGSVLERRWRSGQAPLRGGQGAWAQDGGVQQAGVGVHFPGE